MNNSIIRTSKHYFSSFSNSGKRDMLSVFLDDANSALCFYVDYLWNNRIEYTSGDELIVLDIKNNQFNCPSFISTKDILFSTDLSARSLKCISTQACGIVRAVIDKKKRLEYIRQQLLLSNKSTANIDKQIEKITFSKPEVSETSIELNSICASFFERCDGLFSGFLKLSSLGKKYGKIYLPIKYTKQSNKWQQKGQLLKSFLISKNSIDFRWQIEVPSKLLGEKLGIDTGMNTVAYCSDGQHTTSDIHGHDLSTICDRLSKKQKGSKSFRKTQSHRENYINWSINQLNLTNIKELHIEDIFDLRRGKASSRKNSHFTNSLTEKKLISLAEELGVRIFWKSSFYRSQRCFCCGFVSEKNRKSEVFCCLNCGNQDHSDLNAAKNQLVELPDTYLFKELLKKEAFFFQKNGFFRTDGSEITVPVAKEMKDLI